jgi:hypothetical protein
MTGIVAWAAQRLADREQAVARLAAVTTPAYAHEMRRVTGGDVRQLDTIARLHVAQGFDDRTRAMVREAYEDGPRPYLATNLDAAIARAYDVPVGLVAGGLPEPRPNLRLQLIDALGLAPVLTRMCEWLASALERLTPVLTRLDPRPSARRRRRPARTVTVTLHVDTAAFDEALGEVLVTMGRIGVSAASAGTHLAGFGARPTYGETFAAVRTIAACAEIRAIARAELRAARQQLDHHVDAIYADLGLERDPHLIRGEH